MDLFSKTEGVETPFWHFLSENVKKLFGEELEEKGCGSEQINEKILVEQKWNVNCNYVKYEPDGKRNWINAK